MTTRVLLLVSSVVLLLLALVAGLERLGAWPAALNLAPLHGPLMVAAFFGALIALERAVGLGQAWTYLAPALMALGGLVFLVDPGLGSSLLILGALFYVLVALKIYSLQPADFTAVMALGAAFLLLGDLAYFLLGQRLWAAVLWAGYLILIIAGERLELGRFFPKPPQALWLFAGLVLLLLLASLFFPLSPAIATPVLALAWIGLALWLLRYDVAWVNLRRGGVHRFMGLALLIGYAWLLVAGILALVLGLPPAGPRFDAVMHAVYLGFVFSMVFGHAPVIFPAVLRLPIRFHPAAYLPLWGLELGLSLRLAGDLLGAHSLVQAGAWLSALAIVAYFAVTMVTTLKGKDPA